MTTLASLLVLALQPATEPPPPVEPAPPPPPPAVPAAVSQPAPAPAAPPASSGVGLLVGFKVGGMFPQPFSKLGAAVAPELEIGAFVLERRLAVFLDLGYAQPGASGTVQDPRVPDGSYHWKLVQRDLTTSLGLIYRLELRSLVPYFGAGFRLHLQESIASGDGGTASKAPFGESRETRTKAGGILLAGAELKLGAGSLLGEIEGGYAPLDNRITGNSNMGALTLRLGYRIFF